MSEPAEENINHQWDGAGVSVRVRVRVKGGEREERGRADLRCIVIRSEVFAVTFQGVSTFLSLPTLSVTSCLHISVYFRILLMLMTKTTHCVCVSAIIFFR